MPFAASITLPSGCRRLGMTGRNAGDRPGLFGKYSASRQRRNRVPATLLVRISLGACP